MEKLMTQQRKKKQPVAVAHPRREQLLLVALDLFSRQDFSTVTIKDIAAEAGINTALIYYYFENKQHLFRSALELAVMRSMDHYHVLRNTYQHPAYLIRQWFADNVKMSDTLRQLLKITLDYNSQLETDFPISDLIEDFYREEEQEILSSCIQRGAEMGIFKAVDPDATARFISVHLDGIMFASLVRKDVDIASSIDQLEMFLWRHLDYDGDLPMVSGKDVDDDTSKDR